MVSQVFYLNSDKFPAIANDYQQVKANVDKSSSEDSTTKSLTTNPVFYALEVLPPIRRTVSIPDKIEKKDKSDIAEGLGIASLALINLPEDLRDMKGAVDQIKGAAPKYDYKEFQHPFSFLRGTLLHNPIQKLSQINPKLAKKIFNIDKTLLNTDFGEFVMGKLNVEVEDIEKTTIKDVQSSKEKPLFADAIKFKGNGKFATFGEITARAMTRTTTLGLFAMSLLELPNIFKSVNKNSSTTDNTENIVKQTLKSTFNVAFTTADISYGGAIGFKKFGAAGSLIGMGLGAVIGNSASHKLQNTVN